MAEKKHGDSGPFTTEQSKFFDGSEILLVTASRAVLRGRLEEHKKGKHPPRMLLVISVPLFGNGVAETAPEQSEAQLLLGNVERGTSGKE